MKDLYRYATMQIFEEASKIALNLQSAGYLDNPNLLLTKSDGTVCLSEDYSPYISKEEWLKYGLTQDDALDMLNMNNFHDALRVITETAEEVGAPQDKIATLKAEMDCLREMGFDIYRNLSPEVQANYHEVVDNVGKGRTVELAEINYNYDLTDISDSMLLPSDRVIAEYKNPSLGVYLTLETAGDISINYKGVNYKDVRDFPDELKDIIRTGYKSIDEETGEIVQRGFFAHPDIELFSNNWFGLYERDSSGAIIESLGTVDCEGYNENEIKSVFKEAEAEIIMRRFKDADRNVDIEQSNALEDYDKE